MSGGVNGSPVQVTPYCNPTSPVNQLIIQSRAEQSMQITRLNKYKLRIHRRCATENNERKVSETDLTIQKFNATEQK